MCEPPFCETGRLPGNQGIMGGKRNYSIMKEIRQTQRARPKMCYKDILVFTIGLFFDSVERHLTVRLL